MRPPRGERPVETWLRCAERPRPTTTPSWLVAGGRDAFRVVYRLLSSAERALAQGRARKDGLSLGVDPRTPATDDAQRVLVGSHILAMAARDARRPQEPAFSGAEEVRQVLTLEELLGALGSYGELLEGVPDFSRMVEGEYEVWIDHLARGASQLASQALDWGSADKAADVPGIDVEHGVLDCHFLCWCAARRVLYPEKRTK